MAETSTGSAWIRRFHTAPDSPVRLVCFPYAGSGASYYHPLSRALAPDVQVLAVQYPGRQDRADEPCAEDLTVLADRVAGELLDRCDPPFVLFGHSMGAVVAYEVALRLEALGVPPRGLVVTGRRAPSLPRVRRVRFADDAELVAELKRLNAGNEAVTRLLDDEGVLRIVLPTLRGDYRAIERYHRPSAPPLRCPVVAMGGDADPVTPVADLEAWERHATASFRLRVFRGGHFFLDTHTDAVRQEILDHIAAVTPR
ncbi:thioesterase II family protein [Streptomyces sp. NPDC058739]|uniref:thioesterase II family protein n=1 Tax=Streptomyces sp. NPDC058739 TaxID=3346618 RepID=UPI0036A409EE